MESTGDGTVEPAARPRILRRLMSSLRKQQWIAIAIDLAIVMLGVFLGLQAQQWAEDQKQSAQQQRYMERLDADFSALKARQEPSRCAG